MTAIFYHPSRFLFAFLSLWNSAAALHSEPATERKELIDVVIDAFVEKKVVQKSIVISNSTGSKASIINVKSSCGCVITSFPKKEIQSEDKVSLVVTLDISSKRNTYSSQLVVFWSNQAISEVELGVSLTNLLLIDPPVLRINPLSNEPNKVIVTIRNSDIDSSLLTLSISDENGNSLTDWNIASSQSGWIITIPHLFFYDKEKLRFFMITVNRNEYEYQTRYLICKQSKYETK